jgi:hypothetical protein
MLEKHKPKQEPARGFIGICMQIIPIKAKISARLK